MNTRLCIKYSSNTKIWGICLVKRKTDPHERHGYKHVFVQAVDHLETNDTLPWLRNRHTGKYRHMFNFTFRNLRNKKPHTTIYVLIR